MLRANFFETKRTRRTLVLLCGLAMMICTLLLLLGLQSAKPAHAASTFTVNSTGDAEDDNHGDGVCQTQPAAECTLRAAIEEANAKGGKDTINFNIPGNGPHTIAPGSSGLPPITQTVTIDGYTQSGAIKNNEAQPGKTNAVLMIELDGNNAQGGGLVALGKKASKSVVRGLAIHSFGSGNIRAEGVKGIKVEGNFIGTTAAGTFDPSSTFAFPNGVFFSDTDNSTIGGTDADDGTEDGVVEARNLISVKNSGNGVQLADQSTGNKIQGNLFGTDKDGNPLSNGNGIAFSSGSSKNTVGGTEAGAANTIAFSLFDGVEIFPSSSSGTVESTGNRILSNSIFSNGAFPGCTSCGLGISMSTPIATPTPNDPDDPNTSKPDPDKDTGPNNLQNYPVITSAQTFAGFTSINGTLESTPKKTFIIQFFSNTAADPSGFGEGQTFLGEIQVKTDRQGKASLPFAPAQTVSEGEYITATATNKKGDTSEFSNAKRVDGLVIGP